MIRHVHSASRVDPVYQAIWADNRSFDEVLISKRMVQDHMPDKVLEALDKVSKSFLYTTLVQILHSKLVKH